MYVNSHLFDWDQSTYIVVICNVRSVLTVIKWNSNTAAQCQATVEMCEICVSIGRMASGYALYQCINAYIFYICIQFAFFISSPQGIAFRNIPLDKDLYAMVCSTSAKSSVRLINTTSFRDCLQFRCMKVITKYPQLLDVSFKRTIDLPFFIYAQQQLFQFWFFPFVHCYSLLESAKHSRIGELMPWRMVYVSKRAVSVFGTGKWQPTRE